MGVNETWYRNNQMCAIPRESILNNLDIIRSAQFSHRSNNDLNFPSNYDKDKLC
jgi:hypothetical protein